MSSRNDGAVRVGRPMFRQPTPSPQQETPQQPQNGLEDPGAGPGPTSPQNSPQGPQDQPSELWTPNGATAPTAGSPADDLGYAPPGHEDERKPSSGEPSSPSTASSRASTPVVSPADRRAIKATVAQGVKMGTTFAHEGLKRDDADVVVGIYLADEEDVECISDPAAGLLSRRMGTGAANPDITDGISLLMAVANYVAKQLIKMRDSAMIRAHNGIPEPGTEGATADEGLRAAG